MSIFRRMRKPTAAPGAEPPKCPKCGSTSLKRVLETHPVPLTGNLEGRRLHIYRVEMDKCRGCGALTPTAAGQAKIERCTKKGIEFFLAHLPPEALAPGRKRAPRNATARSAGRQRRKPPE